MNDGYKFVSFDVESLFTNVPLKRTLQVIERKVYLEKLVTTNLKKNTLMKLIRDACTKTAFICNDKFYEQTEGVSMGSSLGPILANIIMCELEDKVIRKLINNGVIKFYTRFVDDTMLLVKPENVELVKQELEKFDRNLKFTYDCFEDEIPHFLDIELHEDGLKIYRKDTFTGHFTHFDSFVPWSWKISWMRSLITRMHFICDKKHVKEELTRIRTFASWNGFPVRVRNSLTSKFLKNLSIDHDEKNSEVDAEVTTIWLNFPYVGQKGEQLVKSFIKKLRRFIKPDVNVRFRTRFTTKKLSCFTNVKDPTPFLNRSNVVYEITCPGCGDKYVGKTDRTLFERTEEHGWDQKDSAVNKHLVSCPGFVELFNLFCIPNLFSDDTTLMTSSLREFSINTVRRNIKILDTDRNWNVLLYKEALYIKRIKPSLNAGLKASRKLNLFR